MSRRRKGGCKKRRKEGREKERDSSSLPLSIRTPVLSDFLHPSDSFKFGYFFEESVHKSLYTVTLGVRASALDFGA